MNILPAANLASAATNVVADLFSGTKKAPGVSNTKNAPASSNTKNTPDLSGAKNTPAFLDPQNAPALSGAQKAPAPSNTQTSPGFAGAKNVPLFSNTKNIPALSGTQNTPAPSNTPHTPNFSGAQKAPVFSDVLRQAEEAAQRANSGHSQDIRHNTRQYIQQDIRERMSSAMQEYRHSDGRQAASGTQNSQHSYDMSARQTAETPAGNTNSQHSPRQREPLENQQLYPLEFQQHAPLEKAPVAMHSTNGVHYQLGEVGFTQQELAKLRDKLLKEGLSPQSLSAIEQLASHPHGATLGQLLALMQGSLLQQVSFSNDDKMSLQHFADKIDTSGELGKNMLALLENGQPKEAWDALKSSLNALQPQDLVVFNAGDAALLCKAFGVSQQTSLEVLRQFGNAEGTLLTSDTFTALMLPAQQEILDKAQQNDKLGPALAKHLQPLIDEARQRSEKERQAANSADRKTKQSEILIRDRFMDKFREDVAAPEKDDAGHNPLIGKKDASDGKNEAPGRKDDAGHNPPPIGRKSESADRRAAAQGQQAEAQGQQGEASVEQQVQPSKTEVFAAKTPLTRADAPVAQDRQAAVTVQRPDEPPAPQKPASGPIMASRAEADEAKSQQRPRSEHNQDGPGDTNQDTRRDSRWESVARVEVRHNAQAADMHAVSTFTMPTQPQAQAAGHISSPAPLIRQALQQVEQGTLSKLANGGQRLELQLAPSELGAVTLILTSGKSGEISATIRSEKSETAELVARHLDMIRVSLEEQGLKVDKLEVQNQMLHNQDDWQGMEQHNAMREEQERREQLERLRRLGRQSEDDELRARDMQSSGHTAEISGQGLHLVA